MVFEVEPETTRSLLPSPLKSATFRSTVPAGVATVCLGREGAVTRAEQHGDGVVGLVGDREIELAVAVEIARDEEPGACCPR